MKPTRLSLVSLLILAQLLPSCQNSVEPVEPGTTTGGVDTTTAEPSEYTVPNVDYGGAVFTFLDYDTSEYFWQAASYSDVNAEEENGDPINDAQYKRNNKVEDELNVTIKTYPITSSSRSANGAELQKLVLAGDDSIDAAFVFASSMASILSQNGMLQDLASLPTLNLSASWWNQSAIENFTLNGQTKVITGDFSIFTTFAPLVLYYNKAVAEDFDIGNLYELVRSGTWTWDKVFEYCERVAGDIDGNNVMNHLDRYGIAMQRSSINTVIAACGANITERDKNGDILFALNTERTVDIIETFVPFLNNSSVNCIAELYSGQYDNVSTDLIIPMFEDNRLLFSYSQLLVAFELRACETDFGLLPLPKFDMEQEDYYSTPSNSWPTVLCVPATNNRPDMTGVIFDAMGYYSQQYVTPAFIDTTVRRKSLRDEDSAEMLQIVLKNQVYDIGKIYNWGKITNMLSSMVTNNSTDFSSEYAKIESQMQSGLAATLDALK